jgi:dipeptidyl aminopeptidase/acylaminoacyl peptidase
MALTRMQLLSRTILFVALLPLATDSSAQNRVAGNWEGYWISAGDSMAVALHVKNDSTTNSYTATFDSDRLRVMGIPFDKVDVEGCCNVTMRLVGDRTTTVFSGAIRGNTFSGDLREEERNGRFSYQRMPATKNVLREREVTFQNGEIILAGSLILPSTSGRHPAVVFLHGSGAEGRWASRYLATSFANHGVAALTFDKRGVGKSSGDWRTATIDDLAGDAAAAVAYLGQQKEIDPQRIGIYGHSQGGTLAPMIAQRSTNVAFIIASAASGVPTDSTEIFSILSSIDPKATSSSDSTAARAYVSELVAVAYHGKPRSQLDSLVSRFKERPWFFAPPPPDDSYWSFSRVFSEYHPAGWWKQVRVPVLLLYGAEDKRVPANESAARIAGEMLRNAPDVSVTVRIFPEADHTFRLPPGPSGWPKTAPDYMTTLLSWLSARGQAKHD